MAATHIIISFHYIIYDLPFCDLFLCLQLHLSYHRSESAHCSAAVVSVHVEMALHHKCWGPEQVAVDGAEKDTLVSHPCHGY